MTLGTPGSPSDTGYDGFGQDTVVRAAGPFNNPTKLVVSPDGDLYITDGYGNARVHRFSSNGEWISSWGQPGSGPGQFRLPHGLCIDRKRRVLVADREYDRIQLFGFDGSYLGVWEHQRPNGLCAGEDGLIYVCAGARRVGQRSYTRGAILAASAPMSAY